MHASPTSGPSVRRLLAERRRKLERLREAGVEPVPARVRRPRAEIAAVHERARRPRGGRGDRRRATGSRGGSWPAAATARPRSSTSSTRTGQIQLHSRADVLGDDVHEALVGARPRRHRRRRRDRLPHPPRRALAAGRRRGTLLAKSLRPPPDKFHGLARHRDPLPPPRARPDRQRGGARAASASRGETIAAIRRWLDERRLRRGRDAGAAAALRRRPGAAVRHPPQRARPRPLPADRDRALPEAAARRRDRARLRARQGLPQRGHLAQAQPRVHDARVVRGLRRLRRRRRAARAPGRRRRRAGARDDRWSSATGSEIDLAPPVAAR